MAKTMARIESGVVINMEWCSDDQAQSNTLIDTENRPVRIGDTYDGANFYHNGEKVRTLTERLAEKNMDMESALEILLGGAV